ncbi:MAG: glycosyltransferase family 4 protein [Ardenticatenaceae bacterium]|nr:glycosyltransferase family 4 protein [Ardenticatenaceae bacterium]MCB8987056.1 glycosyltransferase family 4 protein [Ardenticatenaceae bacterium]
MQESDPNRTQSAKIAILTLDFYPQIGGVQSYLFEIARRLGSAFDIAVVTPQPGELPPATPLRKVKPPAPHALGFWQVLRQKQPDFVIVGHAHPQLLLAAALYGRKKYAAITYGNDYLAAQKRWHHALFNKLLNQANPLVTISEANVRRLLALNLNPTAVVHPGTDPQRFHPAPPRATGPVTLLTVARLVPRKGIDTVLKLMPSLLDRHPRLLYRIVGSGPDRERLEELVHSLTLSAHVEFVGRASSEELPKIYRNADIFVMLTREEQNQTSVEGFGIVYLEASASGLPIVATHAGGVADAVHDNVTGLLVSPDNPDQALQALTRLIDDEALRHRLGQAGRRLVEDELNWDKTAVKFQALLTAVLPGSSSPT